MSRSSSPRSSSLTDQHGGLRHGHPQVPPSHEDVPQEACRASRRGWHQRRQERRLDYQEVCRTSSTSSKLIRMFSLSWSWLQSNQHPQLEESRSLTATALESSLFVKKHTKATTLWWWE